MTEYKNRPPIPEIGVFQTVEWDETTDYWLIRDMTQQELDIAFPKPTESPESTLTIEEKRMQMSVSAFQIRIALVDRLTDLEEWIKNENKIIQMTWEYAVELNRMSQTILSMQIALGFTDEEMDELFNKAKDIKV